MAAVYFAICSSKDLHYFGILLLEPLLGCQLLWELIMAFTFLLLLL